MPKQYKHRNPCFMRIYIPSLQLLQTHRLTSWDINTEYTLSPLSLSRSLSNFISCHILLLKNHICALLIWLFPPSKGREIRNGCLSTMWVAIGLRSGCRRRLQAAKKMALLPGPRSKIRFLQVGFRSLSLFCYTDFWWWWWRRRRRRCDIGGTAQSSDLISWLLCLSNYYYYY